MKNNVWKCYVFCNRFWHVFFSKFMDLGSILEPRWPLWSLQNRAFSGNASKMVPKRPKMVSKRPFGSIWGPFWVDFGRVWGDLGRFPEGFGDTFGGTLARNTTKMIDMNPFRNFDFGLNGWLCALTATKCKQNLGWSLKNAHKLKDFASISGRIKVRWKKNSHVISRVITKFD